MLCLTACISLMAQNISGKLVDEAQQPLPYANVVLQTVDSAFVTGTTTGEKGEFKLQKIVAGDYRLAISSIGYQSLYLSLQGFERTADVGTLTLADASQELGEVTVTASSRVSRADQKLIFPSKKQISASNNGVDMLRHLMLPRLRVNSMDGSVGMVAVYNSVSMDEKLQKKKSLPCCLKRLYVLSFKKIQVCAMAMQVRW